MSYYNAFFSMGFRPFFAGGIFYGIYVLTMWMLSISNTYTFIPLDVLWHAHEMVFGFITAIIAGFLLTAIQNWTGRITLKGWDLAGLFALWGVGRAAYSITENIYFRILSDLPFLFILFVYFSSLILSQKERRNYKILGLVGILFLCNLGYYLSQLGFISFSPLKFLHLAIIGVFALVLVIAARVIPFFSKNALENYRGRDLGALNVPMTLAFICWGALFLLDLQDNTGWMILSGILFAMGAIRLWNWFDKRVWNKPILLILYFGYLWVVLGFAISFLTFLSDVSNSMLIHSIATGVISTFIVAMVTRVSLGHSGRQLLASKATISAYILILFAAVVRVFGVAILPEYYFETLVASAVAWIISLSIVFVEFLPVWASPRLEKH